MKILVINLTLFNQHPCAI